MMSATAGISGPIGQGKVAYGAAAPSDSRILDGIMSRMAQTQSEMSDTFMRLRDLSDRLLGPIPQANDNTKQDSPVGQIATLECIAVMMLRINGDIKSQLSRLEML